MPLLYSEHTSGLEMFAANSTITGLQEIRLTRSVSLRHVVWLGIAD